MDSPTAKRIDPVLALKGEGALVCSKKNFVDGPRLLLTCEEVIGMLQEKLSARFKDVRHSFNFYNTTHDTGIEEVEFRDMIVCLGLDMTEPEYRKLWRYFDRDCDGTISYYEWNNVVGKIILPLSDITLNRPESPNRVKEWTRRAMARGLTNLLKDETDGGSVDPIGDAFREVNSCRSGQISHEEFIQLCKRLKVPYNDDEETFCMFKAFQDRKTNTTGQLSLPEFKKFVENYLAIPKHLLKKLTEEEQLTPRSIDELERLFTLKIVTKYATVQKAWRSMDQDRDNTLSVPEFRTAFESMNMPLTDNIYKAILARFDPEGKGHVTYSDFNKIIGAIIHPNAKDTSKAMLTMEEESGAQNGLYFVPTARLGTNAIDSVRKARQVQKESVKLGDHAKAPLPSMESFPEKVGGFRSPKSSASGGSGLDSGFPGGGGGGGGGGSSRDAFSSATVRHSEEPSSAAAAAPAAKPLPPVDVGKVEERMRKVLGRGWVHAAADIKKAASGAKAIPTEVLRDVLAEKGVPLTAREANALASRYSGSGGGVNVDGLLTQAFKASFAGASVPLAAAAAAKPASTSRSSTAALASSAKAVAAKGPPSAFSKQSIF